MKAHLVYASVLCLTGKPGKAITLLKCLAQVLPPIPHPCLIYTHNLRKANNLQQLLTASSRAIQSASSLNLIIYKNARIVIENASYIESKAEGCESPTYYTKNNQLLDDVIFDSPEVQKDSIKAHRRICSFSDIVKKTRTHKRFETLSINTELSSDQTAKINSAKNEIPVYSPSKISSVFIGLSLCLDSTFLYKIGKIAAQHKVFQEDGLCALDDFLFYLRYEFNEESKLYKSVKALYWKAILLMSKANVEDAQDILKEISPDLLQLGMRSKLERARELINQ